ncbi:MAG: hypothetical protein M3Y08_04815 [Fibrobacterota bacterium]|nr:hypothetical protein [Fibrobacterota bacterium]
MVWVYIALFILALALVLLQLFRFHFSIDVETPASLRGSIGVSFLWFRREMAVDAVRAVWGHGIEDDDDDDDDDEPLRQDPPPHNGQRGALRIPDAWFSSLDKVLTRLRKTFIKWALDLGVWRILFRFSLRSGRRILGLLGPALKSMYLGMEDVFDLGRIAAAWSVVRGTVPALAAPVEFGFCRPFAFRAKVAGGFTGLEALFFGFLTLFSFPYIPLAKRFLDCWREPRLNRWQRRVLLP